MYCSVWRLWWSFPHGQTPVLWFLIKILSRSTSITKHYTVRHQISSFSLSAAYEHKNFTYSLPANFATLAFTLLGSVPWCWGHISPFVLVSEKTELERRLKYSTNAFKRAWNLSIALQIFPKIQQLWTTRCPALQSYSFCQATKSVYLRLGELWVSHVSVTRFHVFNIENWWEDWKREHTKKIRGNKRRKNYCANNNRIR